jgi:hypothetical protein
MVLGSTSTMNGGTLVTTSKMIPRPPTQTQAGTLTVLPETIQEMPPNQEDETSMIQNKSTSR